MPQGLRTLIALQSTIPSTYMAAHYSSFMKSDTLFLLPMAPGTQEIRRHTYKQNTRTYE